jgi:steroid delta-isomerase-like uncharacterized protein
MKRITLALIGGALATIAACMAKQQEPPTTSHKALIEAYVDAWNRHDSIAVDTLLAKDGIHEDVAFGMKAKAPDEVNALMRDFLKSEPDFVWKLTKVVDEGDAVAAEWTWASTYTGDSPNGPVTALKISGRGSSFAEIENGKIKRFTDYYDEASFFPKRK